MVKINLFCLIFRKTVSFGLFFNDREAIAAFIGDIVVFFYNPKHLDSIGVLSFLKICSRFFRRL